MGDDLLSTKIYHPTKFQPNRANGLRDMRYQSFSVFGPWALTPGPKFTKRGDDLLDSEIYHSAKFHPSTPTHSRDIFYKISCGQTDKKKQTVNDICATCLSACVDNKYASCPDWRISPHADRRSPRNTNSLQHRPSPTMRRNVFHSTHGPRWSCKFAAHANERRTCYRFFDF